MSQLICPFLSREGAEKSCLEARCALWSKGENSSECSFAKMPKKEVARLDTLSAQVAEMQVLMNMIVNKM